MPATGSDSNTRLGNVIDEAGVSAVGLARRMAEVAAEWGLNGYTNHTQIGRWRAGQVPRVRTQLILAEALSRKLGRRVGLNELGFGEDSNPAGTTVELTEGVDQSIDYAVELWKADVNRQPFIHSSVTAADVSAAALSWLLSVSELAPSRAAGDLVTDDDVEGIRANTSVFASLDNKFGGQHSRLAAVQYLDHQVTPMLKGAYSRQVGNGLFAATAELTLCVAWMAYDSGWHSLARRHFILSLSLARQAGERELGASVLSALSHQANLVGDLPIARDLARAARHAAQNSSSQTLNAQFASMEARALATIGARKESQRALAEAHELFAARDSAEDPPWITYFDEAELAAEAAHCQLALRDFAGAAASLEKFAPDADYARSNAFAGVVHTESLIGAGQMEKAAAIGAEVLASCRSLASARIDVYLAGLEQRIEPFADSRTLSTLVEELKLVKEMRARRWRRS